MDIWEEWRLRRQVLDEALRILLDGKRRSGRQIASMIGARGKQVTKSLVNSVLFSEGRRYVTYDRGSHTYSLRGDPVKIADRVAATDPEQQFPLVASTIEQVKQYSFDTESLDSPAFFRTETRGGSVSIVLNKEHPFYRELAILGGAPDDDNLLIFGKLKAAQNCIKVLLQAWSDFENEQPEGRRARLSQDARLDWGRKLRDLLLD